MSPSPALAPPPAPVTPAALLARAADALACPLLLLGTQAELLHANRAGRDWLAEGRWLRLGPEGRVTAEQPEAARALGTAVARAALGTPALLPPPAGARGGCATLRSVARAGAGPAVLLMLGAADDNRLPDLAGYAELRGLSPAETRVLAALARGATPAACARELGVALSTVRTQVAALRRKTGHASLGALLREVASLPPLRATEGE